MDVRCIAYEKNANNNNNNNTALTEAGGSLMLPSPSLCVFAQA